MNQEKFNLTWHTYTDHLREMLHNLLFSEDLTDVTLVSEDKKRFKAHKVVLSACSPLFKTIISDSNLSSPIIYLRGIQSLEIESILQFIYLGRATFYQERMNEFIDVARSLEVKEISKDIEIPQNEQNDSFEEKDVDHDNELKVTTFLQEKSGLISSQRQRQLIKNSENKYPCELCNYEAPHPSSFQRHKESVHEGVKYPCDQCKHISSTQANLRRHIKSVHEGVKYPCYQCNYKANYSSDLKKHLKHCRINNEL